MEIDIPEIQGRRQREGQWCPAPPFEIGAPHFTFGPLVATCIQYCIFKMWPPLLVFGPSFWFLAPLLLIPGDGPAEIEAKMRKILFETPAILLSTK